MTLLDAWKEGTRQLKLAGIEEDKLDAWYLMEFYFQIDKTTYLINPYQEITEKQYAQYLILIQERAFHKPLQYITGEQEFMGFHFYVNEHVLIPRQDTELLVEEVLKVANGKKILDMCTGSGCIIISIAKLSEPKKVVGVDISKKALGVAKKNGSRNGTNIEWIQSDLFENITGQFDIIVSNPPYIETKTIEELMPEVRLHEPVLALDGRADGLYFYDKIIRKSEAHLKEGGSIFFEIGYNQGEAVKQILRKHDYRDIKIIRDYANLDRVVCGIKGKIGEIL